MDMNLNKFHNTFSSILLCILSSFVVSDDLYARGNLQLNIVNNIQKDNVQKDTKVTEEKITENKILPNNPIVEKKPLPVVTKKSEKLSLDEIHALYLQYNSREESLTRAKSIITGEPATDLYTQSQAHMSVPEVKRLIDITYNTKNYQFLINSIIAREKNYEEKDVFYHGLDNEWRVPQDLYTKLYFHFNPAKNIKDFIFLRFDDIKAPSSIQNFLLNEVYRTGLVNDHTMELFLMAANLALFGNVGTAPECTWQYFIKSRGHATPDRIIYEKIMDKFGLTHKYIDELMKLTKIYNTSEQTILQIFIPKDKVNKIGYLSWIRGNPAHEETINMVLRSVKDKKFDKTATAITHYAQLFKKEHENNPVFKNLIDRINSGEFSLRYFLNFYRNRPNEIEGINNFQARLFVTSDILLNPLSGAKIFRYSTATLKQLQEYEEKLDALIKKLILEKK
jgi:hypothetical protein